MSNDNLEQSGKFGKVLLTEILRELSAAQVSGSVRVSQNQSKIIIYLEKGEIVYAAANLKTFRLGECAVRWKLLSPVQLNELNGVANDFELVKKFLAARVFDEESIKLMQKQQVSEIVRLALSWTEGEWAFSPLMRLVEGVRIEVETSRLLMEAARSLPIEHIDAQFLNQKDSFSLNRNARNSLVLLPRESFLLSRFDSIFEIAEIKALSGMPEVETLKTLYALWIGGFLQRHTGTKIFSEDKINQILAVKLEKAAKPMPKVVPQSVSTNLSNIEEKAEKPLEKIEENPAPTEVVRDEKREMEMYLRQVENGKNYYEFLGISPDTDSATIKKTYFSLAKQFHPDKFHQEDEINRKRIQQAFTQIAHSYETLKESKTRETYDFKLRRENSFQKSNSQPQEQVPKTADEFFDAGMEEVRKEHFDRATAYFGQAVRLSPNTPRYRAQYGKVLSKTPRFAHQAEAEIQTAVRLSGNLSEFRIMLAEFYRDIGFPKRAISEVKKILSLEPNNTAARNLLESLE